MQTKFTYLGSKNRKRPAVCGKRGKVNKVYSVKLCLRPVMETELLTMRHGLESNASIFRSNGWMPLRWAERGPRYNEKIFVIMLIG